MATAAETIQSCEFLISILQSMATAAEKIQFSGFLIRILQSMATSAIAIQFCEFLIRILQSMATAAETVDMMRSSYSSNRLGAKYLALQGIEAILSPQAAATTFAFSSVEILLL